MPRPFNIVFVSMGVFLLMYSNIIDNHLDYSQNILTSVYCILLVLMGIGGLVHQDIVAFNLTETIKKQLLPLALVVVYIFFVTATLNSSVRLAITFLFSMSIVYVSGYRKLRQIVNISIANTVVIALVYFLIFTLLV